MRFKENMALGRGGVGRWRVTKPIADMLAVHPWRVIIPIAVVVSLAAWLINKESLTRIILKIFSGI